MAWRCSLICTRKTAEQKLSCEAYFGPSAASSLATLQLRHRMFYKILDLKSSLKLVAGSNNNFRVTLHGTAYFPIKLHEMHCL